MPLSDRMFVFVPAGLTLLLALACGGATEGEPLPPITPAEPPAEAALPVEPAPVAVIADTGVPSAAPAVADDDPVSVPAASGDPSRPGAPSASPDVRPAETPKPTPPKSTVPPKPSPGAAPAPAPAGPKTPKNAPPPKPSGITQVNGTSWKITRSLINQWQNDPYKLGNARESGEGWQLIGIRQRSAYHLGMRNSDIVLEVNGHKLNTQPQLLAAYLACKNDTKFDVTFLRDGRRVIHHYTIVD